ncbi:MAG: LamG domain-containing protein [Lewinella sp.]|nr:LamG domain-containing protein [Lewinella sp.]
MVAYYSFAGNLADFTGNSANGGVASGVPSFGCGVEGQALRLNGGNDFIRIPGGASSNVNREFDTEDFSISFYFKPIGLNGTQYLVSKRDTACSFQNYFYIRYAPLTRTVGVYLRQGNLELRLDHRLTNGHCWQHLVLVRANRRVRLYANSELVGDLGSTGRIDILNTGELTFGSTNCRGANETAFAGLLDEIRVYNRAIDQGEIESLFLRPDQIINATQRIFLGESIEVEVNADCGTSFEWSPADGVSDPTVAEPTITPMAAGTQVYALRIDDAASGCLAFDSLNVQVIDPSSLDCSEVFLPRAFTPNGIGLRPTRALASAILLPFQSW